MGKNDNERIIDNRKGIKLLERITAGVIALLLLIFFIITLNNMSNITNSVEDKRSTDYPVSVAAGHVETGLSQLSAIAHMISLMDIEDSNREVIEQEIQNINYQIRGQIAILTANRYVDDENIHNLTIGYEEFLGELDTMVGMLTSETIEANQVRNYAETVIYPNLQDLIRLSNNIIDNTSNNIDELYEDVSHIVRTTIVLCVILVFAIIAATMIFIALINRKEKFEETLSNHLGEALTLARNADIAKSQFLGNMSHDIRTPLNAIIGLTTIANDNIEDKVRVQQCLSQIDVSSQHLLQLINDVLDINRIESGKLPISEEVFSVPDLVSELSVMTEPQSKAKHIDCQYILQNIDSEFLIGDPMRIRQVLINIIGNAIKYTNDDGSVRVTFSESSASSKGFANLKVTVEDNGIGMDEAFLPHIFEPFERESNEQTNFIEGTGLGLAITKNLVTMMGGTITVDSKLGEGSTFTIVLSLKVASEEPEFDPKSLKGKTVTLFDDDHTRMNNLVTWMNEFGMTVKDLIVTGETIAQLKEDIERLSRNTDAIIIDIAGFNGKNSHLLRRIAKEVDIDLDTPILQVDDNILKAEKVYEKAKTVVFLERPLFKSRLYETLHELFDIAEADLYPVSSKDGGSTDKDVELHGRVLVVEDNDLNMEIAKELIGKQGPEVEGAMNGLEAVDLIKDKPDGYFDLIFMDWQMPKMNGIEATKAINEFEKEERRAHTPIVAMTANAFNENRQEALASGMDGFMAKPINVKELKKVLREYLS